VTTGRGGAVVSGIDLAGLGESVGVTIGIEVAADEQAAAANRPTMVAAANREYVRRIPYPLRTMHG
jgi:hypothetical protein